MKIFITFILLIISSFAQKFIPLDNSCGEIISIDGPCFQNINYDGTSHYGVNENCRLKVQNAEPGEQLVSIEFDTEKGYDGLKISHPLDVCHNYTTSSSCQGTQWCIYDQTDDHTNSVDTQCENMNPSNCTGPCQYNNINNICETKTYCRGGNFIYSGNISEAPNPHPINENTVIQWISDSSETDTGFKICLLPFCFYDGITAHIGPCNCGQKACLSSTGFNLCTTIDNNNDDVIDDYQCSSPPSCSNTDGTAANANDCQCGNTLCTSETGLICYSENGGGSCRKRGLGEYGYPLSSTGFCYDASVSGRAPILDVASCQAAANSIDKTMSTHFFIDTSLEPPGCFFGSDGEIHFNYNVSSTTECFTGNLGKNACICQAGTVCSNTDGTAVNSGDCMCGTTLCTSETGLICYSEKGGGSCRQQGFGKYGYPLQYSDTCGASDGRAPILDAALCESAANSLGKTTEIIDVPAFPPGCVAQGLGAKHNIYFNNYLDSTVSCDGSLGTTSYACICQTAFPSAVNKFLPIDNRCENSIITDGPCFQTKNYGTGNNYGSSEFCQLKIRNVVDGETLSSSDFNVGDNTNSDALLVNSYLYDGTTGPQNVTIIDGETIIWQTDSASTGNTGFKVCLLAPCSNTDGTAANYGPCQCGTTGCTSETGYFCDQNTCSEHASSQQKFAETVNCDGSIITDGPCFQSKNYGTGNTYGNNEFCELRVRNVVAGETMSSITFDMESTDFIKIKDTYYTGDTGPQNVAVNNNDIISWSSDNNVGPYYGFKICLLASCSNTDRTAANANDCQCGNTQCTSETGLFCNSIDNQCSSFSCRTVPGGTCTDCDVHGCTAVTCDMGKGNADNDATNGCEVSCATVTGGTCTACTTADASGCTAVTCDMGKGNADNDATNGCEVSTCATDFSTPNSIPGGANTNSGDTYTFKCQSGYVPTTSALCTAGSWPTAMAERRRMLNEGHGPGPPACYPCTINQISDGYTCSDCATTPNKFEPNDAKDTCVPAKCAMAHGMNDNALEIANSNPNFAIQFDLNTNGAHFANHSYSLNFTCDTGYKPSGPATCQYGSWNSPTCDLIINGCTDISMANYNSNANKDDGTCVSVKDAYNTAGCACQSSAQCDEYKNKYSNTC